MDRRRDGAWAIVATLSAFVVLGPTLLRPGGLLSRDAVFTPAPVWSPRLLGLSSETARAVPSDAVITALAHILPGSLVAPFVLLVILVAAGWGAARLVGRGIVPGAAAAVAAVWNPYVAERLAMGHWALLVGYAALPWVVAGLDGWLTGVRHRRAFVLPLAVGALGGAAALVVLAVAVVGGLVGRWVGGVRRAGRTVVGVALALVVAAVPWAAPSLLRAGGAGGSDPTGFVAFAARADLPLGVVVSVVTGGGVWNADVVPVGRDSLAGGLTAVVLLVVCLVGVGLGLRSMHTRGAMAFLAGSGFLALSVVGVSSMAALWPSLAAVPGGGLLRDPVRQSGPWVLLLAVGLGHLVARLPARGPLAAARWGVGLVPIAAVSGMAFAGFGARGTTVFPPSTRVVADWLNQEPDRSGVVVLPFAAYRAYPWNDDRASLTPWSRMIGRRVVTASDLTVNTPHGRLVVRGEDLLAKDVGDALAGADPAASLARLGIGWVVVDDPAMAAPKGATRVLGDAEVSLWRLPAIPTAAVADDGPPAAPVLALDVLALLAAAGAVLAPTTAPGVGRAMGRPTMR